ncbi:hypothetical protein PENTCL1PPCAC_23052, partial [Pristionchus entomophagus]
SLAAFDRLNLNESDVISHLCSVAVEKCQSKVERRLAGCGGHHMRKRVLIKNFVSELMKKQQDLQSEEGMEEEGEGEDEEERDDREEIVEEREDEIELEEEYEEEEEEVDLNENMLMIEKGRREEEDEEREERVGREWYNQHSSYSHSDGGYSSPSPPLEDDEREKQSLWSLPVCTSPDSMALHLRDPYETRDGALYQSCDPYSFSSSFSLSPPSDDENSNMGAPWHENDTPSRLSCSPPFSLYDDLYSSSPSPSPSPSPSHPISDATPIHHHHHHHHHHYDMPTHLLDGSYDSSSIRVVATGESDTAFLAMGGERPLQEMRSYATMGSWSNGGGDAILFDLSSSSPSSPSSPSPSSSPSTPTKKRRSDEMSASI